MKSKVFEWFGVITAILYSMMVALNINLMIPDVINSVPPYHTYNSCCRIKELKKENSFMLT